MVTPTNSSHVVRKALHLKYATSLMGVARSPTGGPCNTGVCGWLKGIAVLNFETSVGKDIYILKLKWTGTGVNKSIVGQNAIIKSFRDQS